MLVVWLCVCVAGTVRVWGREKVAHRLRQLRASSEYSVLKTSSENGSDQVGHQLARQPPPSLSRGCVLMTEC